MTSFAPAPDQAQGEEAASWCLRLTDAGLSAEEQQDFDHWLSCDQGNAATLDRAFSVWQMLHLLSDTPEIIGLRSDALESFRNASQKRWARPERKWRHWPVTLAASVLLACVGGGWFVYSSTDQFLTGNGERRAVLLSDGSRLTLDSATRVSVDYEPDRRQLKLLTGRAKFDVAKDEKRPFTVTAGDQTIVATGTSFTVELLTGQVRVIVYNGHVIVLKGGLPAPNQLLRIKAHPDKSTPQLTPGSEMIASLSTAAPPEIKGDLVNSLAWESGQLEFVDEPLSSAVERVNRYSAKQILVSDPRVAEIRISGVFNAGESDSFAEATASMYGLRIQPTPAGVKLSAFEPGPLRQKP